MTYLETAALKLPPGRTEAEAIAVARKWVQIIWFGSAGKGLDENAKIDLLEKTCIEMCSRHKPSGERLAKIAAGDLWPSPSNGGQP